MINFIADASEIANIINGYLDMAVNFMKGLPWPVEIAILLVVAILLIVGLVRLFVKSWKLVLALVILGGVGFAVYFFFLKDSGTASESAMLARTLLQYFL